jgi:hypothetical protein
MIHKTVLAAGVFAALFWLTFGASSLASPITLADENSTVTLDPSTSSGVSSWTVDGVNQLYQQWFWYRVGSTGIQYSIDTLGSPTITQATPSQASLSYTGTNGVTIKVTYLLSGGLPNSGNADLGESIAITNGGTASQDVHFYQYSNFTLGNTSSGQYVQFQNSNAVDQWNGNATQNPGETLSETVITPRPNFREAGEVLDPSDPNYTNLDTLYKLNNIPSLSLAQPDLNSPSSTLGPGDVTWAYEWDRTIAPNSTFIISKDKELSGVVPAVPEPSSLALMLAGFFVLAGMVRQRLRGR